MPIIHAIKPTFSGGEYSPSLYSRVDLQRYSTGAKTLRNFFVHPHGGVSNRCGTYYEAKEKTTGKKIRLIPFEFSTVQTYVLEFGEYYCRFFYRGGGQVVVASAPAWVTTTGYVPGNYVTHSAVIYYCLVAHTAGTFATDLAANKWIAQTILEVPTPYAEADLAELNYTQSADVLFLMHPDFQTRQLNRLGAVTWTMTLYDSIGGPFMLPNTDNGLTLTSSGKTGTVTLTASGFTFDPLHVGSLWQLSHDVAGQDASGAFSGTGQSSSIACGGTWRLITHGTWTGKIVIEKSTDGGSNWTALRTFTSTNDFNVNTSGTEDMTDNALPFLVRMNCTALSSGTCNYDLTTDPFTQKGIAKITVVAMGGATATAEVKRAFGATTATIDWAEGSWSDFRGWPAIAEFSPQDRLVFANTVTEPQTEWMTKAGNYYDFSRSDPLVDSDGITTNLPSRQVNGINGIVPLSELIMLTSLGEWGISPTVGNSLTPTTVDQKIFGYEGSSGVRPVVIGNRAIYVQSMGSVVRDLGYELQSDSFVGNDLRILSDHLFSGYSIINMTYQQNPDRLVWAIRSDGAALSMTYMREQDVVAWTHHDTNGGTDLFEDVCCIPGNGFNEVWFSVNRGGTRFIERMPMRMASKAPEDQFFVDCGITYNGAPANIISGLGHLEGKSVAVLADGNVLANYLNPMTVTSGQIVLDPGGAMYSKVHIGLPIVADCETLNIEVPLPDGTLQGRQVKISQLVMRLLNSRGGWIGPNNGDLKEIQDGIVTNYNSAITLFSGDLAEQLATSFEDGGRIFFRQYDPLPVTILAFLPLITVGGTVMQ